MKLFILGCQILLSENFLEVGYMGRLLLLNSAICHFEGVYRVRKATPEEIKEVYERAKKEGRKVESYIGYPDTAQILYNILGDEVEVNRGEFTWEKEDIAIVVRLKYRVQNPKEKGKFDPRPEDFEFLVIEKVE